MSKDIKFEKTVYDKNQYEKLVDTNFSQLDPTPTPQQQLEEEPTVNELEYCEMFYPHLFSKLDTIQLTEKEN